VSEPPRRAGDPPDWAGEERVLLRGGSVYSAADPFATAMLVHGPEVAWVGSEGAALAMADGVDAVVELDGALVTPAFVDADVRPGSQDGLAALADGAGRTGIASLHVLGDQLDSAPIPGPGPLIDHWSTADAADHRLFRTTGRTVAQLAQELAHAAAAGPGAAIAVSDHAALSTALAAVQRAAAAKGSTLSRGLRLHGAPGATAEEIAAIAALGLTVVLAPEPGAGLAAAPVAALAAAGVPLAFGSAAAAPDPWSTVRAAVHHRDPDQRISGRAAFAAHTRGGWRAAGNAGTGTLVPGAAAHYTVWEVGDLVVAAPDDRIQAWSTDPRSGTPGLPDLGEGAILPRCLRTAVWGRTMASRR
jgi:predicted amidohydrolase YtcJ